MTVVLEEYGYDGDWQEFLQFSPPLSRILTWVQCTTPMKESSYVYALSTLTSPVQCATLGYSAKRKPYETKNPNSNY